MCTVPLPPDGYPIAVNKYAYQFGSGAFEPQKCEPEGKRSLGRPSCKWKENIIYLTANGLLPVGSGFYACT
jgi:hypothetical protein